MVDHPGVAGKFFSALGKARVNIRAIAQGSSERNISAVIDGADSQRALRAVHAAFYLSNQTISIGVIGSGLIGGTFLDQLMTQMEILKKDFKIDLRIRGILNSKAMILSDHGRTLLDGRDHVRERALPADLEKFVAHVQADHFPHAVILDCTSSAELTAQYPAWLERGIHIITPNKKANTGTMEFYRSLRSISRATGRHYLYETTVGAGLPIINTEPDPRDDLSGMDVGRKLVILAREMGLDLELDDVRIESLVPESLRESSLEEFLERLPEHDEAMVDLLSRARDRGEVLRYVGMINPGQQCSVELKSYSQAHAFAGTSGSDNIVAFTTQRYHTQSLIVQGPGAGPEVTAGGVFADLLRLASYLGGSA
ncbi:MAG: ACT domain-containing protein [Chthoniobacterales bacterium]